MEEPKRQIKIILFINCDEWEEKDFQTDDIIIINDFLNNPNAFLNWDTKIKIEKLEKQ